MSAESPSAQLTDPKIVHPPKLLDRVQAAIGTRHYSRSTEQTCVGWIRRFVLSRGKRHPREMATHGIGAFLTHLALDGKVSGSTQNQVLNALIHLYKQVLERDVAMCTRR